MVLKSRKFVEINQIKHLINKSKGDHYFYATAKNNERENTNYSPPPLTLMTITNNNATHHHFDGPWQLTMSLRHFTNGPLS